MSLGVSFESDPKPQIEQHSVAAFTDTETKGIIGFLLRMGIVQKESTAKIILIGITCVCFLTAILVYIYSSPGASAKRVDQRLLNDLMKPAPSLPNTRFQQ